MPEKHIYECAVIRVVPKVEREELINVGVILSSKRTCPTRTCYDINEKRLRLFAPEPDIDSFRGHLEAFSKICAGYRTGGAIAQLEIPERFRWLTVYRSSCIQVSRPHMDYSDDLEETLERLSQELVL